MPDVIDVELLTVEDEEILDRIWKKMGEKEFDESLHPRDDHGRWTTGGLAAENAPATERLTVGERNAVERYSGVAHGAINRFLRGQDTDRSFNAYIPLLDSAIEKTPPLTQELSAWRGLKYEFAAQLEPGMTFRDKAYVSTTDDPGKAEEIFAGGRWGRDVSVPGQGWTLAEVKIPAGTKAFPLSEVSMYSEEREYLLGRDHVFRVASITDPDETHLRHAVIEVVK